MGWTEKILFALAMGVAGGIGAAVLHDLVGRKVRRDVEDILAQRLREQLLQDAESDK